MDEIPGDLIGKIVPELSHRDIVNLCEVNKFWERMCHNPEFWIQIIEKQYKTNINCVESLKMIHLLWEQNLIQPIQIMIFEEKIIPFGKTIIKITDTVGDILLRLYDILGLHSFSSIENRRNDRDDLGRYTDEIEKTRFGDKTYNIKQGGFGYDLLCLEDIETFWNEGTFYDQEINLRKWFKTPISKVLLSFNNIEILFQYPHTEADPWQPIITEWLTT